MNKKLFFCLGGADLEMEEIKKVLIANGQQFANKGLAWNNAKASAYAGEINSLEQGTVPVLVELVQDLPTELLNRCVVVDHHNQYVGRPSSLLQVLELLEQEATREQLLIAANDSGYIPAMLSLGATRKEVEEIRALDWAAQGITPELVAEALEAYKVSKVINGVIVVEMEHFCFAPVTDTAFWDQPSQNILFKFREGRTLYFGKSEICSAVYEQFKDKGWKGANFVGNANPEIQNEMAEFVLNLNK